MRPCRERLHELRNVKTCQLVRILEETHRAYARRSDLLLERGGRADKVHLTSESRNCLRIDSEACLGHTTPRHGSEHERRGRRISFKSLHRRIRDEAFGLDFRSRSGEKLVSEVYCNVFTHERVVKDYLKHSIARTLGNIEFHTVMMARLGGEPGRLKACGLPLRVGEAHRQIHFSRGDERRTRLIRGKVDVGMTGGMHSGGIVLEIALEAFGIVYADHRICECSCYRSLGFLGFKHRNVGGTVEIRSVETFGVDVAYKRLKRVGTGTECLFGVELFNRIPCL